ncbi:hypothetical protein [Micromonospora coxensis]|uniref:Uncharacterized protein n=1 Tax=Micromonospora coxensis TaxID=356852 RepID=A0A1C5JBL0_9ACTN|nr:hypothetical protein [Micromonospora coxensis]SCG67950.1 hypothetical protein GA0070614_4321 [Micromonospora coxensis]
MSSKYRHGKRRRSLWRRLVDWFRGAPRPTPSISNEEVIHQPTDDIARVSALSHGDVFEFQVDTALVWSSRQMSYDDLVDEAREFTASARDTVRERIWQVARGFSPYQSAAAEQAIQQALADTWCYRGAAGTVHCSAKAWVRPDPKVRDHLMPFELRELELEANTALALLRADRFEEVARRWQRLFDELGHDAMVAYAAQLTDPAIAGVVTGLVNHRRASAVELADVLRQASKDHEHVGLYEFAAAYDAALQNLRRQMHLDENGFPVADETKASS